MERSGLSIGGTAYVKSNKCVSSFYYVLDSSLR